jgi:hypothetical protein
MSGAEVVGDVFAGIAATAGALAVWFASRTVSEARATTTQLEKLNADAATRFETELRHRVLMQFQTVADLLAELGEIAAPASIAAPARVDAYQAIRRQLLAAVIVLRDLGGEDMSEPLALVLQNEIGLAAADELAHAQAAVVAALGQLENST